MFRRYVRRTLSCVLWSRRLSLTAFAASVGPLEAVYGLICCFAMGNLTKVLIGEGRKCAALPLVVGDNSPSS